MFAGVAKSGLSSCARPTDKHRGDDGRQDDRQSQLRLMRCGVTRAPERCQMTQGASECIQDSALETLCAGIGSMSLERLIMVAQLIIALRLITNKKM